MIGYLNGIVKYYNDGSVILDVNGVGYEVACSSSVYAKLINDKKGEVYTYMAVREDGVSLYGFINMEEKNMFLKLISVSGVGPKVALSVLSLLSPEKFALAVCADDKKTISKANGVGAKTAARIVLELKDKLMKASFASEDISSASATEPATESAPSARKKISEATDALTVLGYNRAQINTALASIDTNSLSLEEIIKAALKKLM